MSLLYKKSKKPKTLRIKNNSSNTLSSNTLSKNKTLRIKNNSSNTLSKHKTLVSQISKFAENFTKKIVNNSKNKYVCSLEEQKLKDILVQQKLQKEIVDKCKKGDYPLALNAMTLKELLGVITRQKTNNVNDLLNQFPHSGIRNIVNTDSHVFEALWILIFLFNYDDLLLPEQKRVFYKSIEKNDLDNRNIIDILKDTNVNGSNTGGIADIYFKHLDYMDKTLCPKCKEVKDSDKCCKDRTNCEFADETAECGIPACNSDKCKIIDKSKDMNKNYLFSAKYFNKEKGVEKYDIPSMFIEALPKLGTFNLMLLVKDKELLDKKMDRSKKQITRSYHKIMDVSDLDKYYKLLKYDLTKSDIDTFVSDRSDGISNDKPNITPRFHQQYFIDYTMDQIKKENYKICWGAVPRSGKSYMIGGLIAEKKPEQVVIFLGAVTETISQFYDMFNKYDNFEEYNIVNTQIDGYKKINIKKKNIVLISQQKGWKGGDGLEEDDHLITILQIENKIIFFDEIHQGSSIGDAQGGLLNRYVWCAEGPLSRGRTDLELKSPFIMVTATFSKPLLNYMRKGKQLIKLIQWSYDDIQLMKDINKPNKLDNFLEKVETEETINEDGVIKAKILHNLIYNLDQKGVSLDHLSKEYDIYPELVVLCPELEELEKNKCVDKNNFLPTINIIDKSSICDIVFKCSKHKLMYETSLLNFINYIQQNVYQKLLLQRFDYNVYEKPHTQLWFLPTPSGCQSKDTNSRVKILKEIITSKERNGEDYEDEQTELDELKEGTGIENTTRLLAQFLTSKMCPKISEKFCISCWARSVESAIARLEASPVIPEESTNSPLI